MSANSRKTAVKNPIPNNKPFKKGESGNPTGRPKLPPEINAIRTGSKPQIIDAYGRLATMSVGDAYLYEPKNLIEAGIKTCLVNFGESGETGEISKLWDQVHGKPTESMNVTAETVSEIIVRFAN